jgi:mRNA interferase RelE/StbE
MKYSVEFKPKSHKDLKRLPKKDVAKILHKIEEMSDGLVGDVKKLTKYTPEYRMRHGNYRVLFEIEGKNIIVYRILNRKEAYK